MCKGRETQLHARAGSRRPNMASTGPKTLQLSTRALSSRVPLDSAGGFPAAEIVPRGEKTGTPRLYVPYRTRVAIDRADMALAIAVAVTKNASQLMRASRC